MATDSAASSLETPVSPSVRAAAPRQYWQLPVFLLGLSAAILAIKFFPPQGANPQQVYQRDLKSLAHAIEKRPIDPTAILRAAKDVAAAADQFPDEAPKTYFLLGSAHQVLAELGAPETSAENWSAANTLFAKCDVLKLADQLDQQRCVFRSAKAAAAVGVGDAQLLIAALNVIPSGEDPGERGRLLAESCLRTVPPDLKKARDELAAYLSGPNRAPAAIQAKYRLKLGELCLSLNEPDRARTWLSEVGDSAPADVLALAKVQLGRLAAAENNWKEAVKLFEAAQSTPGVPAEQVSLIRYETGRGWLALSNPESALPYFEQAEKAGGPIAVAARLRLAEIAIRDGTQRGKRSRATELIVSTVQGVNNASEFRNPHVSLDELRAGFEEIIQVGLNEGDFPSALKVATAFAPIALAGRHRERAAEVNAAWASALEKTPEANQAVAKRQQAAEDYLAVAAHHPNPNGKVDLYRRAATCWRKAGDDRAALSAIEQILMVPGASAESLASANLEKGELLLAANKFTEATDSFKLAMTAAGATGTLAHVKFARAYVDEGKRKLVQNANRDPRWIDEAKSLIDLGQKVLSQVANKNFETGAEREAQQEALFELGKIHVHQRREYAEAEARFRQLIQSNPAGIYAEDAKLYLGTCLLLTAKSEDNRLPTDSDRKLTEALGIFQSLTDSKKPTIQTQADLRVVRSMYLLRRFDDMPELCSKLSEKYRGRVEELIVMSMMYWGYKQADRNKQAEQTLTKMQEVYSALPEAAFTGLLEEYTRNYWEKRHDPPLMRK